MLLLNGHLEESLAENRQAFELNPNGGENLEVDIARVLILLERYDEAIEVIARIVEWERNRDYLLALLYNAPGRKADADAALKRLAANSPEILDRVRLAEIHAFRGMNDAAFDLMVDLPGRARAQPGFRAACALVFPGRNTHVCATDAASFRSPLDRADEFPRLTGG